MPFVSKTQKEIEKKERETQNKLIELLRKSETPEQKERIKALLREQAPINLYEEVLKEAPTEKQVVGAATELATLAALGKLSKLAAPVKSKLIRYPLEIAKSGTITGTLTGAEEAMKKEATKEDILKQAKKGAKIGAAVTAALIGAGELIPRASRLIGRQWQKAVKWAEKELAKEIPKGSEIEKTLATIGEERTFKQKVAQKVLGLESFKTKLYTRFLDKNYIFDRIERMIVETKQRPLKEYEKVGRDIKLLYSIADVKSEAQVLDLLNKYGSLDEVTKKKALAYITQLDYIERAKLGLDVPKGQTLEQLQAGLKKIVEEIGDDMPKVEEFRKALQNHFVNLLNERVEAGVISKELRDKLLATHPNYIPHKVLIDIDERAYQFIKDSFNVPHSDIMRAIGSTKNIKNPLVASINKTIIANRVIEKNKLLNNLARTLLENPDLFPGVREISKDAVVPEGFGKINYLVNGKVKTLMVPKDLEVAIKNIDRPLTPSWFRLLTAPQRIFKKFATQLNPSFAVPNKFRDAQTAAITSASFIEEAAKRYGLTPLGIDIDRLTPKEILKLYRESGGWGANIFQEGDTEYIFSKLTKIGITKKLGNLNPLEFFEKINDSVETSTRLEVFKTALKQGLSPKDAAWVARNATIDFSKMGSWMEPLNRAIPFLNARVQGFVNIASSLFKNPEVFARTINWITTYPAILLHAHNRRFETYGKISQYIKNRYWVIMIGETDGIDPYTGEAIKVPQFITIPKSEGQQMIASPIQWYLEKEDKTDYRKVNEMIIDIIGEASPMWFQSWSSQNLFLSLASQMGPVVSVPMGLAAGKSPFYGTPIVPPEKEKAPPYLQYSRTTPRILRWAAEKLAAAKILNVSPAQIDF
ncbi:MAG: LPD38 domain-containing protein, partial [Candidatus Micrarchaeia archaeon]